MTNIYIAGPFSKSEERKTLEKLIEIVKKRYPKSEIYIPMEYKVPGDYQKLDGTWNLSNPEWGKAVYDSDIQHLNDARVVFALYVGHYCSSGTVWEVGYAKGKGIPVIAYIPEWLEGQDVSLMVMNSFDGFITDDGIIKDFTSDILSKYNQK